MTQYTEGWLACREQAAKVCDAKAEYYPLPHTSDGIRTSVAVAKELAAQIRAITPPSEQASRSMEGVAWIAAHSSGMVHHFAKADGWEVITVMHDFDHVVKSKPSEQAPSAEAESLARQFHEAYERLAPQFGYETRTETRQFDPESPNGRLMIAVCAALRERRLAAANRRLDAIRNRCRVVCFPANGSYPIEHNPIANKDSWEMLLAELEAKND